MRWLFFLALLLPTAPQAGQVTVKLQTSSSSYYDFVTGKEVSSSTISGVVSVNFNIDEISVTDSGESISTRFGEVTGATWSSPFTSSIPLNPFSGAYGPIWGSYACAGSIDLPYVFWEQGCAQAGAYLDLNSIRSEYYITFQAIRRSAPKTGDFTSDYAFDRDSYIEFLRSFIGGPELVYFSEQYYIGTYDGVNLFFQDGKRWTDSGARIIEVINHAAPIPEPSTYAMMALGLGAVAYTTRRRKQHRPSRNKA